MSFDWSLFLEYAKKCKHCSNECKIRTGISRAYYAAFHCAKDYLFVRKIPLIQSKNDKKLGSHEQIWQTMSQQPNMRSVASTGYNLKILRKKADYENDFAPSLNKLDNACIYAEEIIQQCSTKKL